MKFLEKQVLRRHDESMSSIGERRENSPHIPSASLPCLGAADRRTYRACLRAWQGAPHRTLQPAPDRDRDVETRRVLHGLDPPYWPGILMPLARPLTRLLARGGGTPMPGRRARPGLADLWDARSAPAPAAEEPGEDSIGSLVPCQMRCQRARRTRFFTAGHEGVA